MQTGSHVQHMQLCDVNKVFAEDSGLGTAHVVSGLQSVLTYGYKRAHRRSW